MGANSKALAISALLAACLGGQNGYAGPVGPMTTFTAGTPAKASEVNDNFSALSAAANANDARIAALEAQVAALQTLLQGLTRTTLNGQPTLQFSGVNVQIVSGAGTTGAAPNGKGNLIIGYDEARTSGPLQCSVGMNPNNFTLVPDGNAAACTAAGGVLAISHKSGSHMLVVGDQNNYSQFGGIVAGQVNSSTSVYASVSGGNGNAASGVFASVSGGAGGRASGRFASVSAGTNNTASATGASVSGGNDNTASVGQTPSVSGGLSNTASGDWSSVSGGKACSAVLPNKWSTGVQGNGTGGCSVFGN